ncbi:hypothetical protein [Rhodococcus sp. USK13]|uniref:hypothetical protein n=1 Tax=Rhodococcus sp. USK13 TaxID=2806442 RepID=UPI0020160F79|nr:hypothetical protein [Rhodococcus sp. USK13]
MADGRLATRTRERHAVVHELLSQGRTISYISRALPLDRKTVRRFARAADVHDLLPTTRTGRSLLDEYAPYLGERIAGGCVDAVVLTREITERGATAAASRPSADSSSRCAPPTPPRPRGRPRPASGESPGG